MSSTRRSYVFVLFAAAAFVLASSISTFAQQTDVKIKNFGQMDDRFYRGAQPKEEDYKQLAAIGIKTIIDLTDEEARWQVMREGAIPAQEISEFFAQG